MNLSDSEILENMVDILLSTDSQQEAMTENNIAWVREIEAEAKRRGLWAEARRMAFGPRFRVDYIRGCVLLSTEPTTDREEVRRQLVALEAAGHRTLLVNC